MTQPWFTNEQELTHLWRELTSTYQLINSSDGQDRIYLEGVADMLRTEYRNLTSKCK